MCSRTSAAISRCSPASPSGSSRLGAHDAGVSRRRIATAGPSCATGSPTISWDEIIAKSGVTRKQIDDIAERYAEAKNVVFSWTMGITHHAHGVENVQAIANLALLRGMVGRPGAGLLPIRGHSNVQGIGSVGVTPKLKDAIFDRLQNHFGVQLPTTPGRDTMACMEGADDRRAEGRPLPRRQPVRLEPRRRLSLAMLSSKLDMLVYLSTTLNTGHAYGLADETIILPVLARDEEPQPTTQESMFNYVRLSDGGPARHEGPSSEVDVIATLAEAVAPAPGLRPTGSPHINWQLNARRHAHPRRDRRHRPRLRENRRHRPDEERVPNRRPHVPPGQVSPRLNGRAQPPRPRPAAALRHGDGELRLMTIRSEGQFNTVVYEDYDLYRGVDRRDVILIHPDDIRRFGLDESTTVTVTGPAGTLRGVRLHPFAEIRPGNAAMYYPEANVLVSRQRRPSEQDAGVQVRDRDGRVGARVTSNRARLAADAAARGNASIAATARRIEIRILPHLPLHLLPFLFVVQHHLAVAEVPPFDPALGFAEHRLQPVERAASPSRRSCFEPLRLLRAEARRAESRRPARETADKCPGRPAGRSGR